MDFSIIPLTKDRFSEAVDLVLAAELDTREEIEHHLEHLNAHYIALVKDKIAGVIGWYQDNVNYAKAAMAAKFPGEEAYWVGFFAIDKKLQGKRIGFALINKLQEVVKTKGADKLFVSSVPQTRFYYERQGFKIIMSGKISGNLKFFMAKDL